MYSVYIKKYDGNHQVFNEVYNVSAVKHKLSIVTKDKIYAFNPGDIQEVKFTYYEKR